MFTPYLPIQPISHYSIVVDYAQSSKFEKTQKRFVFIVINLANFFIQKLYFVSIDAATKRKKKRKGNRKGERKGHHTEDRDVHPPAGGIVNNTSIFM